ncbi:MAG: sensor domain-containing protein [Candidatus Dormibacteraeota bacterium]|nr:sensor domain-containing protein [Candidatus Dormibacteraeota bacterium]
MTQQMGRTGDTGPPGFAVRAFNDLRPGLILIFGVLGRRRTYGNLVYVALSGPLGFFYAAVLGAGAALGASLSIFGVGLIILIGCLVTAWGFAMFERELAISLLGAQVPPMSVPGPEEMSAWRRLTGHLQRSVTWKSLAFLVLKLPLGLFTATGAAVLVGGSLALIITAFNLLGRGQLGMLVLGCWLGVLGIGALILSLHAVNWVARVCGVLAVTMLGIGAEERQLWEAQRRAEAAERSRRDLILNVSHELRTPIASIRSHVDTLLLPPEERPAEATADRYLPVVSTEARRLGALVEDLLDLARADSQELTVTMRHVALEPIVQGVVAAIAPVARRDRRVTVAHADPLSPVTAVADPDRLTQVLNNLVRNAVNYTPEGGAVFLQLGEVPGWAWIDVCDTGSGIEPADLARIFERFYRADSSRSRETGGFGLGLPIARELAEAMGGAVSVSSEPGVGSTFRVSLRTV